MYYVLLYDVVDDYVNRRAPYRDEHLKYAREAQMRGELWLGGAFTEPADGALLIFRGDSPAAAQSFARKDPYVINGLVTKWSVRKWVVVIDSEL